MIHCRFIFIFPFFHSNNLQPKNALLDPNRKWPNAIVPYVIADNQYSNPLWFLLTEATNLWENLTDSTELEKLASAFAEYDAKTCIRFIPRTTERDYVSIRQTGGGWVSSNYIRNALHSNDFANLVVRVTSAASVARSRSRWILPASAPSARPFTKWCTLPDSIMNRVARIAMIGFTSTLTTSNQVKCTANYSALSWFQVTE